MLEKERGMRKRKRDDYCQHITILQKQNVLMREEIIRLKDVNKLVSCPVLPDNYKEVISSWRESWNQLFKNGQITETNKIHILNDHLEDYYDETGMSLTRTSDQTIESCHQFVDKVLRRSNYWVKDVLSDKCGQKLYRGILHINGYTG